MTRETTSPGLASSFSIRKPALEPLPESEQSLGLSTRDTVTEGALEPGGPMMLPSGLVSLSLRAQTSSTATKGGGFGVKQIWVLIPTPPPTSCLTSRKTGSLSLHALVCKMKRVQWDYSCKAFSTMIAIFISQVSLNRLSFVRGPPGGTSRNYFGAYCSNWP